MAHPSITYFSVITKQFIESWGEKNHVDAEELLLMHFEQMEERLGSKIINIESAVNDDDALLLRITTDKCKDEREFALLTDGRLVW